MKKCFCLIVALLCFSLSVTAAPLTRIKGKIVDAGTNKPLDFADVLLFKKGDDNPVFHALPDMDGSFGIADVKNGEYSLMIRLVGYDLFTRQNIVLASSSEIVDLGTIPMKPLEVGLAEVEVVAQKKQVIYKLDKKVIEASSNMLASGGTAVDILENTPSIRVDAEGEVSFRGSTGFMVYVDGKPSVFSGTQALEQIPSGHIENIESITPLSARHDTGGDVGIINIITKKHAQHGFSGMVNLTGSTFLSRGVDFLLTQQNKSSRWYFGGGCCAPAIELVYVFCKKMGIELEIDMEGVARINAELLKIRKELKAYDTFRELPNPFNPLTDKLPTEIDRFFNDAIEAARKDKEDDLIIFCRAIEEYFNFPEPNEMVQKSQIPANMYNQIVALLKQQNHPELLEKAMSLIPRVRMDAGLPPLVTPVSQVIASQAVSCALDELNGRPLYSKPVYPFISLIRGDYGKTPLPVDPDFRQQITGKREEQLYDASDYEMQENPVIDEVGILVAENEKEMLLLELFPMSARHFLTKQKKDKFRNDLMV